MRFFNRTKTPASGTNLDQQLVFHLSKSRIPGLKQLKYAPKFLTRVEKAVLAVAIILMIGGLLYAGSVFYKNHIERVPRAGGTYTEGIVGNPQYINPLYASLNGADADLERLVFSRLFTTDASGVTVPDLAESVAVSDGEKTYTIKLKAARWPTGDPVTADDVVFTFGLIQDPEYKSPLQSQYAGVTVSKIDDSTVSFALREPYGRFTSVLNFGILPATMWESVSPETMPLAELNLKPVGSGPFQFKSLTKNRAGTIRSYTLERNPDYYGQAPYLNEIVFKFFPSAQEMIAALNNGQINGMRSLPADLQDTIVAKNALASHELERPQLTALFINLKAGLLSDATIRRALRAAVDQRALVGETIQQDGHAAFSPLPSFLPGYRPIETFNRDEANRLLEEAGWTMRTVSAEDVAKGGDYARLGQGSWRVKSDKAIILKLTVPEDTKQVAEAVSKAWKDIGIKTEIVSQNEDALAGTLANKQFETVVYTMDLPAGDPYPFWHSTGAGNIVGYSRTDVDGWLEQARLTVDQSAIADRYARFQDAVKNDVPAIFLFWRTYVYPQNKKLKGATTSIIIEPADRLNQVSGWYINTKRKLK